MTQPRRIAVGFGVLLVTWYLALTWLGAYLLHVANVSAAAYSTVIWAVIAMTLLFSAHLIAGSAQREPRRRWWTTILTALAAGLIVLATAALMANVLSGRLWAFSQAANVGWLILLAAEATAVSGLAARMASPKSSV